MKREVKGASSTKPNSEQPDTGKLNKTLHLKRDGSISAASKAAFLAAFSRCASVTASAKRVRLDRSNHYQWMRDDPTYAKAFEATRTEAADALEDEASRRAFAGSDVLLIFLLKGLKPEKYRERTEVQLKDSEGLLQRLAEGRRRAAARE